MKNMETLSKIPSVIAGSLGENRGLYMYIFKGCENPSDMTKQQS